MSQGTLYLNLASPRSSLFKDLVEYLKLDIKISDQSDPNFVANFPLKKVPTFIGPDNYILSEAVALLIYLISLAPSGHNFYGKNIYEQGQVWKYTSFVNSEWISTLVNFIYPLVGNLPYDKDTVDQASKDLDTFANIFEEQLKKTKYLVGDDVTLADLFAVQSVRWAFQYSWDKKWASNHPVLYKWFRNVVDNDPVVSRSLKGFEPIETAYPNTAPKK
ncbi:hypothetical protein CANARDRAFT_193144 [[Candida] arabinofermentans NRRL YB-2248]|uniref:GST C-terminal domain-containing protein n=1 Tax=[Candida] arabinofermentans NRRL YB-2248 TaxID=983967 RepID=A0A1E4T8K2_9ASCO|nr:hypothetical protein CANARDRAFT_193144 [[Candida] arabinofermentans NRRL YB-2248]